MIALIVTGSVLAYLTSWALVARYWYGHIRPWTEPIACEVPGLHGNRHSIDCYSRHPGVNTPGDALFIAVVFGLLGPLAPVVLAVGALTRHVITGKREFPEEIAAAYQRRKRELAATIERLEREPRIGDGQ